MRILKKLFKKREQLDVARSQMISDAQQILRILKNSPHASSMDWFELRYHFIRSKGVSGDTEDRILHALRLLVEIGAIGWAGHKGDQICFAKTLMPTQLVGLVK